MNQATPRRLVLAALLACLALAPLAAADAKLLWYRDGKGAISLEPVPESLDYRLQIAGSTSLKSLMVSLEKPGSPERKITLPLAADGSFKATILLKAGPGAYTASFFGSPQADALSFKGLCQLGFNATQALPADYPGLELNDKVLAYVASVMGTTVKRGECWDLAQEALDRNGADWTRPLSYGLALDPAKVSVKPGDIIQFRSVRIVTKLANGGTMTETLGQPDHTAVIHEVLGPLHYRLAHQNLGGKRFVQITELDLGKMTSGQFWIWRPVAGVLFD